MDDSMDAFQLPSLSKKNHILSLKRRRNILSQLAREEQDVEVVGIAQPIGVNLIADAKVNKVADPGQSFISKMTSKSAPSLKPNDTLLDVSDLSDEVSASVHDYPSTKISASDECEELKSKLSTNLEDEAAIVMPANVNYFLENDVVNPCTGSKPSVAVKNAGLVSLNNTLSPGGLCKVCLIYIPKEECKTHVINCMKQRFSSKRDLKLQLQNVTGCPTCGIRIKISEYEKHFEDCTKKNVEVAQAICDSKPVTSSYFHSSQKTSSAANVHKKVVNSPYKITCPSCGKDLTGYNSSTKSHHVNKCLDSKESSVPAAKKNQNVAISSRIAVVAQENTTESVVCKYCNKSLKSRRGLNLHLRKCLKALEKGIDVSENNAKTLPTRKRVVRAPRNAEEEVVQLVKALTKSEQTEDKRRKKLENLKKKETCIPVMLEESPSTRKAALEAKLGEMVIKHKSNARSGHADLPCTPTLPVPSKWSTSAKTCSDMEIVNAEQKVDDNNSHSFDAPQNQSAEFSVLDVPVDESADDERMNNDDKTTDPVDKEKLVSPKNKAIDASETSSKWALSTAGASSHAEYRVKGLLTQFDDSSTEGSSLTKEPSASSHEHDDRTELHPDVDCTFPVSGCDGGDFDVDEQECDECESATGCDNTERESASKDDDISPTLNNLMGLDESVHVGHENMRAQDADDKSQGSTDQQPLRLLDPEGPNPVSADNAQVPSVAAANSTTETPASTLTCHRVKAGTLVEDLSTLVNSPMYSDLTLKFGGDGEEGELLHLHKCMLFCRIPSLLKAFQRNCGSENVCVLTSCTKGDFLPLLDYIYTGDVQRSKRPVLEKLITKLESSLISREITDETIDLTQESSEFQPWNPLLKSAESLQGDAEEDTSSFVESEPDLFCSSLPDAESRPSPRPCTPSNGSPSKALPTVCFTDIMTPPSAHNALMENEMSVNVSEKSVDPPSDDVSYSEPALRTGSVKMSKRKLSAITRNFGRRQKFARMTGSTPKSPTFLSNERKSLLSVSDVEDVTDDARDISAIVDSPSVHCSPSLASKRADSPTPERTECRVPEVASTTYDAIDLGRRHSKQRLSFSQPTPSNKPAIDGDCVFVDDARPKPVKYKFHKLKRAMSEEQISSERSEDCESSAMDFCLDFTTSDSVLLSAATCHISRCENDPRSPAGRDFKTPENVKRVRRSSAPVLFTPMPNYSDMDTPEITKKGRAIGLKKTLGKRKIKLKLKELYMFQHQVQDSSSDENEENYNRTSPSKSNCNDGDVTAPKSVDKAQEKACKTIFVGSDDSDCEITQVSSMRNAVDQIDILKMDKHNRQSIKALENLTTADFQSQMSRALSALQRKGQLITALQRSKESEKGVARGSNHEMCRWLNRLTPGSGMYSPELAVLTSLCSDKQEAIVQCLSSIVKSEETIQPYQPFMFNILPVVYRVMLRLNPSLSGD